MMNEFDYDGNNHYFLLWVEFLFFLLDSGAIVVNHICCFTTGLYF